MRRDKRKKAAYDRVYRKKNRARLKAQKAAWFQKNYDPVAAAIERKKRMPLHVEYCRQPKYKKWKREYDRKRRAGRFGEFAKAYSALLALDKEIRRQMPDRFERYQQSGRKQWDPITQERRRRKRDGSGSISGEFERLALGNA